MKPIRFSLTLVFCLLLMGCGVEGETATAVSTALSTAVPTHVAVIANTAVPPTHTALPATDTAVPSPTNTATSLPATAVPTETPTITPTLLSSPPGEIYFFWDSKIISDLNINPVYSLYLATPREVSERWDIQPLVEQIIGHPQVDLSPGKTRFAFTILEDKNGDGDVSNEGYDRGLDAPNIFTYTLTDGEFARLTSEYFSGYLGWLSDSELAVGFRAINTEDFSWREVISEENIPNEIRSSALSPDGSMIATHQRSGQVSLVNTGTGEIITIANGISDPITEMIWSADSQWLALNQPSVNQLILVNTQSLEAIPVGLSSPIHYLVWSPDNRHIAAVQETSNGTGLFLLNNSDMSSQVPLTTPGQVYSLLWSPDSLQLAMAITEGEKEASMHVLDIENGELWDLWQSTESTRSYIADWSPDSNWLLFFNGQGWSPRDDEAGVYLINKNGGEPYLVLDTSGSRDPIAFYWLPEVTSR